MKCTTVKFVQLKDGKISIMLEATEDKYDECLPLMRRGTVLNLDLVSAIAETDRNKILNVLKCAAVQLAEAVDRELCGVDGGSDV